MIDFKQSLNSFIQSIKYIGVGVAIGVILSIFVYYKVIIKDDGDKNSQSVITKTIQGAPIYIDRILYKDKQTTIDTHYTGDGQSQIIIPNKLNPSANKWDSQHWIVGGFVSTDKAVYVGGGYRYDRFMIVGGPWFRNNNGYSGGVWIGGFCNLSFE